MRRMPSVLATCCASTFHGTLVSSAMSPSTGPATPKHAGVDRFGADVLGGQELTEHGSEIVVVQCVTKDWTASGRGRTRKRIEQPEQRFHPPMSPAEQHLLLTSLQFSFILSAVPSPSASVGRLFALLSPSPDLHGPHPLSGQLVVFTGKLSSLSRKAARETRRAPRRLDRRRSERADDDAGRWRRRIRSGAAGQEQQAETGGGAEHPRRDRGRVLPDWAGAHRERSEAAMPTRCAICRRATAACARIASAIWSSAACCGRCCAATPTRFSPFPICDRASGQRRSWPAVRRFAASCAA